MSYDEQQIAAARQPAPPAVPVGAVVALRELVTLKDLKDQCDADIAFPSEHADYASRKPIAWSNARAALAAAREQQPSMGDPAAASLGPLSRPTESGSLPFSEDDIERMRQWFDSVQDVNPAFLDEADYALAKRVYEAVDMRVPNSITSMLPQPPQGGSGSEEAS